MVELNKIYHGDCLQGMKNIPNNYIDLLLTDPPYGVDNSNKNKFLNNIDKGNRIQVPIINDDKTSLEIYNFWFSVLKIAEKKLKPGASFYIFAPQSKNLMMMMAVINNCDLMLKQNLIWVKNNIVLGRQDYNYQHECMCYGWKAGAAHKFYGVSGKSSCFFVNKPVASKLHPTQKPLKLIESFIKNSSIENDIILDPFMGSGTTAVACKKLERRFIGFELEQKYVDIANARLEKVTAIPNKIEDDDIW
jgi:site-specific DNA-methyltransferase (adenine-specific)